MMLKNIQDSTKASRHAKARIYAMQWKLDELWISITEDSRILEVGAGNWIYLKTLQDMWFKNIIGIDLHPRFKKDYPSLEIIQWNIAEMPFEDQSFDLVSSFMVFDDLIYDFQQLIRKNMLSEIHRVLNINGLYYWEEPIDWWKIANELENITPRAISIVKSRMNSTTTIIEKETE